MKSKFEKNFKKQAYSEVPDKWNEIQKKANIIDKHEESENYGFFGKRTLVSALASVAAVLVATIVAFSLRNSDELPKTEGLSESDSIGFLISDFDVSVVTENEALGYTEQPTTQKSDKTDAKATQSETTTREDGTPLKPTRPVTTTRGVEIYTEIDWDRRSLPGKFPGLVLTDSGTTAEYVYPKRYTEAVKTKRTATLLKENHTLTNTNTKTDKTETVTADIYSLEGFSKELAVGVKFEGDDGIYTYVNIQYNPETLGEFLEAADYFNTVSYGGIKFYEGGNFPVNSENEKDMKEYFFSDASVKNTGEGAEGLYVTVTINCEELEIFGKSFRIYENGYITTNLIGFQYTFFVGEEKTHGFLEESYHISFSEIAEILGQKDQTTKDVMATTSVILNDVVVMTSKGYIPE